MKKIIALLLAAIMVLGLAACASKTEPAADTTTAEPAAEPAETTEETPAAEEETPAAEEEAPAADDVKHVVYIVNGNLGDKSFFDSAQPGHDQDQIDQHIPHNNADQRWRKQVHAMRVGNCMPGKAQRERTQQNSDHCPARNAIGIL